VTLRGELAGAVGGSRAGAGAAAVLRVLPVQVQVLGVGSQDVVGEVLGEPDGPQEQQLNGPLPDPPCAGFGVAADAAEQVAGVFPAQGGGAGSLIPGGSTAR
jgi:hypothetical protein